MKSSGSAAASWLLLVVSTGGAPSATRVYVWRRLKELGALGLHPGVSLLPATAATRRAVGRLAERVTGDGGQVRVTGIGFTDRAAHDDAVAALVAAREVEYAEVLTRLPELFGELEMETARGRVTFAEVEESEADLERFRRWVAKIHARDFFGAPSRARVDEELDRAAQALARFEDLAMTVDGDTAPATAGPAVGGVPALRAVPDPVAPAPVRARRAKST